MAEKRFNKILFIASFVGCPRVWKIASTLKHNNFEVTILEWDRDSRLNVVEKLENRARDVHAI